MTPHDVHLINIRRMYSAVSTSTGYDVVIVVSASTSQADYWQRRLDLSKGSVSGTKTRIISIEEDWPGGAGQLLGTLYAWQKADADGKLSRLLQNGGTVAMYHTAGKGTRMAPLPAAEANNKSAVKLPRMISIGKRRGPISVLEAVIFQTGSFAASRGGRLSVFWGDQIFIPANSVDFEGHCHAEILDIRSEIPSTSMEWEKDWQSYGLIIPIDEGRVLQREKQSWTELQGLIEKGVIKKDPAGKIILGKSLGCFTISHAFLAAMLTENSVELSEKKLKMDTDPHLWMPLTSDHDEFIAMGGDSANWQRVQQFTKRFLKEDQRGMRLFTDTDIGDDTLWWDYGQVQLYHQNLLKLLDEGQECHCLREFFDLESYWVKQLDADGLSVRNSILVESNVKGKVSKSILLGVEADDIDVSESVIINSRFAKLRCTNALAYDCINLKEMVISPGEAVADIYLPTHGRVRVRAHLGKDGKKEWQNLIQGNFYSFAEFSRIVGDQVPTDCYVEKNKWRGYYSERSRLRPLIEQMKNRFIKPKTDNLVEVVWGGDVIEKMKGLPSSGRPIGESWECSTHHQHPSMVTLPDGSDFPLNDLVNLLSEDILGRRIMMEFKGRLPVLVKFLDARQNLSVQVHPSDEKALLLGERDTGKTESWLVLDAEPGAILYLGFASEVNEEEFARDLASGEVNIAEKYLNAIPAHVGDVLFNPPGAVHAVGEKVVLAEIQQSSGVTYRVWDWNRSPKRQLHIPQAMESLDFKKTSGADFLLSPVRLDDKQERIIDNFYFTVDRITLAANEEMELATGGGFQVLTFLSGKAGLTSGNSTEDISRWESILVPASIERYRIKAQKDCIILKSFVMTPKHIDPVIFQTYDVRAVADRYLYDRVCYFLGKGYGTFLQRRTGLKSPTVNVGGGVRLSTERIRKQVIDGILSTGVNVCDVGITSTPELYFSIPFTNADGGINITASHNEAEYNGLKQVIRTDDGFITSISAQEMLQIKRLVLEGDFIEGRGQYFKTEEGEVVRYHNEMVKANCRLGREIWIQLRRIWDERGLRELLDTLSGLEFPDGPNDRVWGQICAALGLPKGLPQPLTAIKHPFAGIRAVIDFGNGSAWRTGSVYSDLGAELVALNEIPDGSFPAHIPDPIKAKYRKQLEAAVVAEASKTDKEVVGIGFDEDADRVIYVRSDGRVVEGDRSLAIQAKVIIDEHVKLGKPGKPRFLGEVKFSRIAEDYITASGGEYILSPTGFAFIKEGTKTLAKAINSGKTEVELFGRKIDLIQNKEPIALAAELSGHQMSGHEENWIFDDALLASIKVLSAIAGGLREGKSFIDLDEAIPRYPATPELNIRLKTNVLMEKQEIVDVAIGVFHNKGYDIDTTDGGLIKWVDQNGAWLGQALIRKSNTQPAIIARVEGKDESAKTAIEDEFFLDLARIFTEAIPKLGLASDDYIRGVLPRVFK